MLDYPGVFAHNIYQQNFLGTLTYMLKMYLKSNLDFECLWSQLKDSFKAFYIKCLAIKQDNDWKNIMMSGFLTMEDEKSVQARIKHEHEQLTNLKITELENLLITHEIGRDFSTIINQILTGSITLRGQVIKLREIGTQKIGFNPNSNVISDELGDYPIIECWIGSTNTYRRDIESIRELEEEMKDFGYTSIEQLGVQWLKMRNISSRNQNGIVSFPVYFKPLSWKVTNRSIEFNGVGHKNLIPKINLRVTLERESHGEYVPIENYLVELHQKNKNKDIVEVYANQSFKSSLRKDYEVNIKILSQLGIIGKERRNIESLLQSEVLTEDFPKLVNQFINLDELQKSLIGEKAVGGKIKDPTLSFQRAITWLFSMLGFQVIELEGTAYKEIKEKDSTRRECDLLIYDSKKTMHIVDLTLRAPTDKKVDDIANLQNSLQNRGVFVEPLIIVRDIVSETKKNNVRKVKILDREDIEKILSNLRVGNIVRAKKIVSDKRSR